MSKTLFACMLTLMPMTALGDTSIGSLTELSTESLRARSYDGAVTGVAAIDCPGRAAGAKSRMLSVAGEGWFSPEGTTDGWPLMLRRDQALISRQDPRAVK